MRSNYEQWVCYGGFARDWGPFRASYVRIMQPCHIWRHPNAELISLTTIFPKFESALHGVAYANNGSKVPETAPTTCEFWFQDTKWYPTRSGVPYMFRGHFAGAEGDCFG